MVDGDENGREVFFSAGSYRSYSSVRGGGGSYLNDPNWQTVVIKVSSSRLLIGPCLVFISRMAWMMDGGSVTSNLDNNWVSALDAM